MRYRRGWIAILVLALLVPLGILAGGGAWGEWGVDEVERLVGFAPRGMKETAAAKTQSPFEGYGVPGMPAEGAWRFVAYLLAGAAGAGAAAGAVYVLGKGIGRGRAS